MGTSDTTSLSPTARERADLAACRELLRGGSRSFFVASLVLPRSVRDPASAVYAFCRQADDAIDGQEGGGEGMAAAGLTTQSLPAALARLQFRLDRAYAGTPLDHPVDRAFAATVARHAVPRALPEALLEGLAWDAEGRAYETLHDLQAYAARVAGAVGAMMAVLMGARDEHVLARACDLGVAMQLSNIARDVGEDARMGRVYLPRAWLRAEGIDAEAFLAAPVFTPALGRVVQRLLAEAETLYRRSEAGIAMLPLGCQPGIGAARRIYAAIGHQVRDAGGDSVSRRAVVTGRRKLALLARSLPPFMARRKDLAEPPLAATRYLVAAVAATPPPPPGPAAIWDLARRLDGALTVASRMHQRDMVARQSNRAR